MSNEEVENLIDKLTLVTNGELQFEDIKLLINPNYTDINGNGCFHFIAEYSFEKFCLKNIKLNKNQDIVNFHKYNEIKSKYIHYISSFIKLLLQLNCNLFSKNKNGENPLHLSIIKNNYIIAKEFFKIQQNLNIYNENEYFKILNLAINNGNCFNKDYIVLIMMILSTTDENKNNIFNNFLLNKESENYELTPLISLCKIYSENIYDKYNEIVRIKSMEYIKKDINNNIIIKKDQDIINKIKKETYEEIFNYFNNYFYLLFIQLIELGANLQMKKESGLVYLMSFPLFQDLSSFLSQKSNFNINYQDKFGNTALISLINNKDKIIQISKDIFYNVFNILINNENINITECNNNGISAFSLCLIKGFYDDAKLIFDKFKNVFISNFNSEILFFILETLNKDRNIRKIATLFDNFKNEININIMNNENKRTLLHYICIYLSDEKINIDYFKNIILFLNSLNIDYSLKDQFERNFLFYFFIDENEKYKSIDPIQKLEFCLQINKYNNLNDIDIFGHNILSYAVQSRAINCIYLLINYGINLNIEVKNTENSIYSSTLLLGELNLFIYFYGKIKDPNIFNHKIYEPFEIKNNNNDLILKEEKLEKGETLYDFLNKENKKVFSNDKKIENNPFSIFKISNKSYKKEFNYFNFIYDDILKILDEYTKDIIIKVNNNYDNDINNNIINDINIDLRYNNLKNIIDKNYKDYINKRYEQREIISENLFRYCLSKNYEDICKFMINEKYNLISICYDLIAFHKYNDLNDCIKKILSENNNEQNKLVNLKNDKGQTIYHILPNVQNNLFFCKDLENHNISNLFDIYGNTPMYYACQNFNIIFIEIFSHYSFSLSDNNPTNVNYNLFIETKNSKTPLEILYEKLNKKDDKILKIIIDISINMKKVYFIPLINFLIQNYSPLNYKMFSINYTKNIFSVDYLRRIIGLFQFYTKELNGNIMIKDEYGNDPFFNCAQNNNYNFLFNVLLEEYNISYNSINNEGKSIIHLIVELSGYLNKYKEDLLNQAIESGFDFNIKDKEDMLPIDYAYLNEDYNIINILINYYINFSLEIPQNRHIKPKNTISYNFCKDSDNFYNKSVAISSKIDKIEDLNELVSPLFKYDKNTSFYQVCLNEEKTIPFSINLVKKDFVNFNEKKDKKFCIQILEDTLKENNKYKLILVDNLNIKSLSFDNFKLAEEKFKEIFKEKTGNDWDNVKNNKSNFKTDYLKYYIFDHSYDEEYAIYDYLKITIKNLYITKKIEFKGNNRIKNLIYYLLVKAYQNKFSIDENNLNVEQNTRNIIQKYKQTAIQKAINILFNIKKLLNEKNNDESHIKKHIYLINSYNDLIPYSNKSNDFNLFNDPLTIDFEISRLTTYYYIENVLKIFLGAIYNLNNMHPLDYIINCLGCKIEEIPKPNSMEHLITEADYIYNYLYSTGAEKDAITGIYKITQSKNDKNFNLKNYENRFIFCHGTKVENILGILSQGLKIAPVQAVNTGKAYGNGIYLSDLFSYSLFYCYPRNIFTKNTKAFMFLVEVAVGKIGVMEDTNVVRMNLSFEDSFITNEGYHIFKNTSRKNFGNGIIVAHDETNVRIKYLVEIY